MAMAATFGEFLRPATGHINAAVSHQGELPDETRPGIIRQLDRLVTTLAHYLTDIAPDPSPGPRPAEPPDPETRARVEARTALRRAAHSLRHAATTLDDAGGEAAHPVVAHLAAAADNLRAGRDVLQSHFGRGPFGGWEGTSYWAPAITSHPVTAALLSELAGHARALAPWGARLSVSGQMDAGAPAQACLDLHTATRWLWVAGTTLQADLCQHPPSGQAHRLLAAIPANFRPPRQPSASGESVPELCQGITVTAERLRHAALKFTPRARWSPTATSTAWRKNALAAAITGHASQIILQSLSERASQLGLDPAVQAGLRMASQDLQTAWNAWRTTAHQWDIISTGHHRNPHPTPAGPEFADLALQVARLAYRNPRWTAAFARNGPIRDPASLAPAAKDLTAVLAAVHHAIDAITRAGAEDQDAVRTASADNRLYLPTRLMSAKCDIPRPYTPAPPSRASTLLASYGTATAASTRAAITLDNLAVALSAPTWTLAALRMPSRHGVRHPAISGPKAQADRYTPAQAQPSRKRGQTAERDRVRSIAHL